LQRVPSALYLIPSMTPYPHESIATTERYLHVDMAYLKRAYEKGARALALRMENETGAVR
jgi:hypothetical protein